MKDIDFLCGTFGKALASVGAYVVCSEVMRSFLVNRMRTFIFTTALPPLNVAWTKFILSRLGGWNDRRERLAEAALRVQAAVRGHVVSALPQVILSLLLWVRAIRPS